MPNMNLRILKSVLFKDSGTFHDSVGSFGSFNGKSSDVDFIVDDKKGIGIADNLIIN